MIQRVDIFCYTANDDIENCITSQQARGYLCEKILLSFCTVINVYRRIP